MVLLSRVSALVLFAQPEVVRYSLAFTVTSSFVKVSS